VTNGAANIRLLLRTSTFQLTLVYSVLFVLSVLVLFGILYWSTIGSLNRQIDATIDTEILGLAEQYERQGLAGLVDVITQRVNRDRLERSVYVFADATLHPLAGNLAQWPTGRASPDGRLEFNRLIEGGQTITVRAKVLSVGPNFRLLVGRDVRELAQLNRVFERSAMWGIAVALALALSGGLLMSLSARRRIAGMNRTARRIIGGDLSERVPITGARDEYDELAANINAMLNQIEALLESVRHVGDSIAHDLKTPLTRLRNRLEILATAPSPSAEELAVCVADSDRLLATFNALLRIARIESGAYRAAFREIELTEIVRDACDLYQANADDKGISLTLQADKEVRMFGDRELLAQAIANLLDNAVKYTPDNGAIDVSVHARDKRVQIVVADTGPGVPAAETSRIQQRFVRLDAARAQPGNGLGLALVRAVVDQHQGTMSAGDNAPGLRVTLDLPLGREPSRPTDR
jgi:signal transduction histidine kinase